MKLDATMFPRHEGGLSLEHNRHLGLRESIERHAQQFEDDEWVSPEQREKAIATGNLWVLQWWPDTPVGSCVLAAADLDVLLAAARDADGPE